MQGVGRVKSAWTWLRETGRSRPVSVAVVVYGLLLAIVVLAQWFDDDTRAFIANAWYLPIGALTVLVGWRVTWSQLDRRQRTAWLMISAAAAASLISDTLWLYIENIRGDDPSESIAANVGYLLYYVILLIGLLHLPQALRSRRDALKFFLDAATVGVAGVMAVWYFVGAPLLASDEHSRAGFLMALAYPVGDLFVLVGLSTVLLRCPGWTERRPILLLVISAASMMIADVLWAHLSLTGAYEAGNLQDVPFLVQYVLFALSVLEKLRSVKEGRTEDVAPPAQAVTPLPYVAVFGGYLLLINVTWLRIGQDARPVVAGAVVLTLLVVARQLAALRENARLYQERALASAEQRFQSLIRHASDVVTIVDGHGMLRFASQSVEPLFGAPASSLIGRSMIDLIHPDDGPEARRVLKQLASGVPGATVSARWRIRRSDGRDLPTDNTAINQIADEHVRGIVLTTRDVSARLSLEAEVARHSHHDPLTGLANRVLFHQRVEDAVQRSGTSADRPAVLFVDLDHFKDINDQHGHAVGDGVIKIAGERLRAGLRAVDTAARVSGDEFAVLLDERSGAVNAAMVGERLAHVFHTPMRVEGMSLPVTVSIGVAVAEPGLSSADLLRNADLAMYLAKKGGRGQAAVFQANMHAALLRRLELQADLHAAQPENQLSLVYQPVHDLHTRALVGAEAFLRWTHPVHGVIPAGSFLPMAQETGLIVSLGRWALHQACRDAQRWPVHEGPPMRLLVNLAGRKIAEPGLVEDLRAALAESGLRPERLLLELTESMLLERTDEAVSVLHELKSTGIQLAIDDFGTGYSSLSYVQRLPIDILKIDRSFIDRLQEDPGAAAVTRAIIALAATLSLRTIAEGIETEAQADDCRRLGCHEGQGYLFGQPIPAAEFPAYIEQSRTLTAA